MSAPRIVGILCVCAAFAASACADEDRVEPRSGTWSYQDGGIVSNSCGTEDLVADADTTFTLTNNGDGTFTVDQGNTEDFDCTIAGNTFECPFRVGGTETNAALGATVSWQVRVDGTLNSDASMTGTQTVEIECDGAGCALAPTVGWTLPCSYEVAFEADKT